MRPGLLRVSAPAPNSVLDELFVVLFIFLGSPPSGFLCNNHKSVASEFSPSKSHSTHPARPRLTSIRNDLQTQSSCPNRQSQNIQRSSKSRVSTSRDRVEQPEWHTAHQDPGGLAKPSSTEFERRLFDLVEPRVLAGFVDSL